MHDGVELGLGVMQTAASEHGVRNLDRSGREDSYSAKAKKVVLL